MSAGYMRKCLGEGPKPKDRFKTKPDAEAVRKKSPISSRLNSYRCDQCGFFHIGKIGVGNRGQRSRKPPKNAPRFLPTQ